MSEDNANLIGDQLDIIVDDQKDAPTLESKSEDGEIKNEESPQLLIEKLNDDLKVHESLRKFKDENALAQSYLELQKKLGSRLENLSEEDIRMIDKKLEIPEHLSGYEFEETKNETIGQIREILAKSKISKKKAQEFDSILKDKINLEAKNDEYSGQMKMEEARKELERDFGFAYKDKLDLANQALYDISTDDDIKYFKDKGLTNDPKFIKMLASMGEKIGEDKLSFKKRVSQYGMTPADVSKGIKKIVKEVSGNLGKLYSDSSNAQLLKQYKHLISLDAKYKKLQ